ncbi:MAG: hypothetical protein JWN72_2479 [Thermoleophilia bacterium]|nr:hypothetical protein [Thermoleophilia bacterium]
MSNATAPAAGWYPDPQDPARHRWWNGIAWTEDITAGATAPHQQQAQQHDPQFAQQHAQALAQQQQAEQLAAQQQYYALQQAHAQQAQAHAAVAGGGPTAAPAYAPTQATTPVAHPSQPGVPLTVGDPRYNHDRFVVVQRIRPLVNKYEVHAAVDGAGKHPDPGAFVAYVQQKRVSMRGLITFYGDESRGQETLALQGDKKLMLKGTYTLRDPQTGAPIGSIQRRLGASIFFKSTWDVFDTAGRMVASATEANTFLAIARRYLSNIALLIPYSFSITAGNDAAAYGISPGAQLGMYTRRWGIRDVYDFDLTRDTNRLLDRRMAVALAVALDALQGR